MLTFKRTYSLLSLLALLVAPCQAQSQYRTLAGMGQTGYGWSLPIAIHDPAADGVIIEFRKGRLHTWEEGLIDLRVQSIYTVAVSITFHFEVVNLTTGESTTITDIENPKAASGWVTALGCYAVPGKTSPWDPVDVTIRNIYVTEFSMGNPNIMGGLPIEVYPVNVLAQQQAAALLAQQQAAQQARLQAQQQAQQQAAQQQAAANAANATKRQAIIDRANQIQQQMVQQQQAFQNMTASDQAAGQDLVARENARNDAALQELAALRAQETDADATPKRKAWLAQINDLESQAVEADAQAANDQDQSDTDTSQMQSDGNAGAGLPGLAGVLTHAFFAGDHQRSAQNEASHAADLRRQEQDLRNKPNNLVNAGSALYSQSKYADAQQDYYQATRLDPTNQSAQYDLRISLNNQGKYADAEEPLNAALSLNPQDENAARELGVSLVDQHNFSDAEIVLRRAVSLKPDDAYAQGSLGVALFGEKEYTQALPAFSASIAIDPKVWNIQRCYGITLIYTGDYADAQTALQTALQLQPGDAMTECYQGVAFAKQNDWADAETAYQTSLFHLPNDTMAESNLSYVLSKEGKYNDAVTAAQAAIKLDANDDTAYDNLGCAYDGLKLYADAEAQLERAVQLMPQNAEHESDLAMTLMHEHKMAGSLAAARAAYRMAPTDPQCLQVLDTIKAAMPKPMPLKAHVKKHPLAKPTA